MVQPLSCAGACVSARFYQRPALRICEGEGAHKYLAIYELEDEGVLHSEVYLKLRAESTPMDFKPPKVQRLVYRQVFPESGAFEDKPGTRDVVAGG